MSEAVQVMRYCQCGHIYGQHYGYGKKSPCRSLGCKCRDWNPKPVAAPGREKEGS